MQLFWVQNTAPKRPQSFIKLTVSKFEFIMAISVPVREDAIPPPAHAIPPPAPAVLVGLPVALVETAKNDLVKAREEERTSLHAGLVSTLASHVHAYLAACPSRTSPRKSAALQEKFRVGWKQRVRLDYER